MRKALVIKYHDLASHFGVDRTVARIKEFYYFSGMRKYIKRRISACIECILAKNKVSGQAGELRVIPTGRRPMKFVTSTI